MSDLMTFPDTVEEFMEQYKVTDTEQVYSNGIEYVPIFRMKQWFEHLEDASEPKKGKWSIEDCHAATYKYCCSECKAHHRARYDYCPTCGARMEESDG